MFDKWPRLGNFLHHNAKVGQPAAEQEQVTSEELHHNPEPEIPMEKQKALALLGLKNLLYTWEADDQFGAKAQSEEEAELVKETLTELKERFGLSLEQIKQSDPELGRLLTEYLQGSEQDVWPE